MNDEDKAKKLISNINTVFGTVCMAVSLYGIYTEQYLMSCAYALLYIAYQQAVE